MIDIPKVDTVRRPMENNGVDRRQRVKEVEEKPTIPEQLTPPVERRRNPDRRRRSGGQRFDRRTGGDRRRRNVDISV